jgi:HSP20 family protein
MSFIRWQPFQEVELLQRDMNRLFERLATPEGNVNRIVFTPKAELQEMPEAIYLSLELPGLDAKDVDIQVSADAVSISGERQEQTQTDDRSTTRTEFRYGRFQRTIALPARIQNTQVRAEYKDGILKLALPKAEAEKHKVVKVNIDGITEPNMLGETVKPDAEKAREQMEKVGVN